MRKINTFSLCARILLLVLFLYMILYPHSRHLMGSLAFISFSLWHSTNKKYCDNEVCRYAVADLRGGGREGRTPPPSASKFFQFHAVFGRIWQNCVFTPPPLEGSRPPPLGEILDPSLLWLNVQAQDSDYNPDYKQILLQLLLYKNPMETISTFDYTILPTKFN